MTPQEKQKVIEALQVSIDHLQGDVRLIEEALHIVKREYAQDRREVPAWANNEYPRPWPTMFLRRPNAP